MEQVKIAYEFINKSLPVESFQTTVKFLVTSLAMLPTKAYSFHKFTEPVLEKNH